ncbi:hypothetical protein [Azospirillum agricola]|uniref:hypothetical protein n=1 Tax=Azospirillum agricola TaxID=1720247 RepID=UPI000A1CD445|nr:hypothetical protein [Azospirillum agricola]
MKTFIDIIAEWPSDQAFAEDAGVTASLVAVWRCRNSVPANRWRKLVRGAVLRDLPVTLEALAIAAEDRPNWTRRGRSGRRGARRPPARRSRRAAAPRGSEAQGAAG